MYVDGATSVAGDGNVLNGTNGSVNFVRAVKDLATNNLKPNQLTGETQFTIILGDLSLDFGDAPDQPYATTIGSNGASHVISGGLHLGSNVDADARRTVLTGCYRRRCRCLRRHTVGQRSRPAPGIQRRRHSAFRFRRASKFQRRVAVPAVSWTAIC